MIKSINIYKFTNGNKFILHPLLQIKGFISIASAPYLTEYNLSNTELLEKILYTLEFSKEILEKPENWKEFQKEFLKGMGVKTMKALHDGTINLGIYIKDGIITFSPSQNKGSKEGFVGFKEDLKVSLPFDSPKKELEKALELALSRCK
ncbi:uncharacterized protein DUF1436 [Flavobacterium araucananum]|uniref:DUF1436 domain-containing protein n=1 Tax=Flavobacterium araucananum TaxID=946678 RepID=A0A227P770_9FLAO|nr:contact-dependent growth inhibition system immunity protein [Flavobacterium araucananum]OXG05343.1 hypothetical protein B0A64_13295 [Flavobacterium araucananum]PWJ93331.1 uncharacterized protein DUF1436 [Flavobacterium araucananum]